ncbi:transposase [Streptomyces sp. H27-H5]|uniref:IS701 family transposase n=1 Tax=Streptomyces sp. H27-H5 TaxID=2996460 RepID=UPI002D1E3FCB|nr:transposase [Streptomyces sp. H27-H5]
MVPGMTLPASLPLVLRVTRPCFTKYSYQTFAHLVVGMVAQTGRRTVTGMLTGAGLSRLWPHRRAHAFFSEASWDPDQLGPRLARAVVEALVPADAPVLVVVDDTLPHRVGKKVFGVLWAHDGSGRGKDKLGFGNTWVIAAIVVRLPFLVRPIALPVAARLWRGKGTASRTDLALEMVHDLAAIFPGRTIHVTGDAAYHSGKVADLPRTVTFTTRLPRNAALSAPTPPRTGKRGRPRKKGKALGSLTAIAEAATWRLTVVERYGRTEFVWIASLECLWYGAFEDLPVRLVLVRDLNSAKPYDLALISTDHISTADDLVERYGTRRPIESVFEHMRQDLGVGQARNRTRRAVERTVPFGLAVYTIVVLWYAAHGHHPADITERRTQQPWYTTKTTPAFSDMVVKLRRTIIAARHIRNHAGQPGPDEIAAVIRAWEAAAA